MKKFLFAPLAVVSWLSLNQGLAAQETVVKWLHIEANQPIAAAWAQVVRDYEAANPGVKIEIQFLENEAYKAKLTTILQSDDRPDIFYSWGGGVFEAQVEAGVLRNISDKMKGDWAATLSPAAVKAFTLGGEIYGAPMLVSQVGFWYNKDLFTQVGVKAEDIATWDDLLTAAGKFKEAGITPIAAGGADKWPLHFYWTHLAIRLGGQDAFNAAISGDGDGFDGPIFVKSGELWQQLTEMEPFQRGYLANTYPEAAGTFGDGKAAMHLMGNWDYNAQRSNSVSKEGLVDDVLGWFPFPEVPGGAGKSTDTLGGINGWIFSESASDEAVDFMRFFLSKENQTVMGREGYFIPVAKGAAVEMKNPFFRQISQNISASDYHQVFYDQMLGPDVGRVVNDVSTDLAAGAISPVEAAEAVQEAWEDK